MMTVLHDQKFQSVLNRLLRDSEGDSQRAAGDPTINSNEIVRMGDLYLSVSQAEGELLYLLARGRSAQFIVEFGASYGISTLYLGAAARDNGSRVVTTEIHPKKCAVLRDTLSQAGLADIVEVLEGDARETLKDINGPVDFVFLDGWKGMYLPVFNLLRPRLAANAILVADNVDHDAAQDYVRVVRSRDSGFLSVTTGKQEISLLITEAV